MWDTIEDSDKLWEEFAMSNVNGSYKSLRIPKFKKGDVVRIRGAVIETTGTVVEECGVNFHGTFEYCVEFHDGRGHHYCFEEEIVPVEGYGRSYKKEKCECGAFKVYGKKATTLHHALWCDMRKGK